MAQSNRTAYQPDVLSKLQETELEILDAIAELCKKHDIHWFLEGGSALGAARHQGFIPWDDDADIAMLREDYDKFLQVASKELPDEFILHVPGEGDYYVSTFAKVAKQGTKFWNTESVDAGFKQEIYIDVFPYDIVSKDAKQRKRQFAGAFKYTRMLYLYGSGRLLHPTKGISGILLRAGFRAAHFVLSRCTNAETLYKKYRESITCPTGYESDESAIFSYPADGPVETSTISTTEEAEFSGRRFPVPSDCAYHLRWMFGENWTELPPENERKSHAPLVLDFGDGKNALETN